MTASLKERFWARVEQSPGCWTWVGAVHHTGYGQFTEHNPDGRVYHLAHRLSYELNVGPIPAGLQIDHLCRNRQCVNPAHLEPVTAAENMRRWQSLVPRATHCKYGHAYDEANTYIDPKGRRDCRACGRERQRLCKSRRRNRP